MSSEEMSKSAKKRANKKARDEGAGEAEAPAPAPQPKAAAAKPEAAAAKAKAAAPKAEPKAEAKAKAKAKSEPKAVAAPKQEAKAAPKAAPKQAASKAKAKAKPKEEKEEEQPKQESTGPVIAPVVIDDGKGGEWEVSAGVSKKKAKQQEALQEKIKMDKAAKSGELLQAKGNQHIPGLAPMAVQMAQGKAGAKAKTSQSVGAVAAVSAEPTKAAKPDNNVSSTIKCPENKIGWIVGPKGANIKLITEKCGLKTLNMDGDEVTIIGPKNAVEMAERAINQLIEKGFMSLSYEDYEEDGVMMHPSVFPDIIGSKGAIIMEIKKQAKVEVNIPAVPKTGPAGKKYNVSLAGGKASVQLGKEILNSIALYGHHELTHPGLSHMELEIEAWRYPFLIGSKGSELRHIQNNYKVKVNIPREHSANQSVVIVGEDRDIERAKKYIDKIIYESEQPRGRGAEEKAEDGWGPEGDVEDWMKPYMYQRK